MTPADHKPIWLNLKKEYVDDNFENLIKYLSANRALQSPDPFYNTTLDLFHARVADLLNDQTFRQLYSEDAPKDTIIFNTRLFATFLLSFPVDFTRHQVFIAMISQLCILVPKLGEDLVKIALDSLRYNKITNPGFSFHHISDFNPEVFAHFILDNARFDDPIQAPRLWENHGRAWLTPQGIMLTASGLERRDEFPKLTKYVANLPIASGLCAIFTPAKEKLKKAERITMAELEKFLVDFSKSQEKAAPRPKIPTLMSFVDGDECTVKILEITHFGHIYVETVDPAYKRLKGQIFFSNDHVGTIATAHLPRYLKRGDLLKATLENADHKIFNIEKQLTAFLVEDTRENVGLDGIIPGQLLSYTEKYYNWIAANGALISTFNTGGFIRGDLAELRITNFEDRDNYGKIVGEVVCPVTQEDIQEEYDSVFDSEKIRRSAVEDFVASTPEIDFSDFSPVNVLEIFHHRYLRLLTRLFYIHQRNIPKPSQRFIYLIYGIILSAMIEDYSSVSFLRFTSTYLRAIIRFATDEDLDGINLQPNPEYADSAPVCLRMNVVRILKEYGLKRDSLILEEAIASNHPVLSSLARLVQAANAVCGVLSASTLNVVKREIIKTLSIETEEAGNLEADGRPYIGQEGETMEFKTSIVFPPDNNMQADIDTQTINVFKPICAFLNSRLGGTIYLGVNDNGYVRGLDDDKRYLRVKSMDEYTRKYIQDPLIKMFGKEVIPYVHISTAFEEDVVVIKVEPHPYRVVELSGTVYCRYNNETLEMADTERQALLKERRFTDRSRMAAIINLEHAVFKKYCINVKSYSSDEGTVSDLVVEPYEVMEEDDLVAVYDIEAGECRTLKISRIAYIEELDRRWENQEAHVHFEVDAFHTTAPTSIRIDLELDLMARNLLIESFPATKSDIKPCKGDPNRWFYSGQVRDIAGIGRFYMGLPDHIKILNGTPLKKYVASKLPHFSS